MELSKEFKEKWFDRLLWFVIIVTSVIVLNSFSNLTEYALVGFKKIGIIKESAKEVIKGK